MQSLTRKSIMYCLIPLLLFVSNVLGSWPSQKPYYDLAQAEKHFLDFIIKHEKDYESYEETAKRFEIFKDKLEKINHWNKVHDAMFIVNEFTDLTHEEFRRTHYGFNVTAIPDNIEKVEVQREWILNAPQRLDYRELGIVSEVKRQGNCGSCFVFSAIGNIESQFAKKHGRVISLSEQQGLDCSPGNCAVGGFPSNVMDALAQQGGSMADADYPYMECKGTCRSDPNKIIARVRGSQQVASSEAELRAALATYGPLSTTLYMQDSLAHISGKIVVSPVDWVRDPNEGHAILVVGYDTDAATGKNYWIIKNSWGATWGDNGYFYLESDKGFCAFAEQGAFSAIVD